MFIVCFQCSWLSKYQDEDPPEIGWSHTQPCSCSKCHPCPTPVSRNEKAAHVEAEDEAACGCHKTRFIAEHAAVVIQKNFRTMVEVSGSQQSTKASAIACDASMTHPVAMGAKSASRRALARAVQSGKVQQRMYGTTSKQTASKGDLFAYVENSVKLKDGQKSKGLIEVFVIKDLFIAPT